MLDTRAGRSQRLRPGLDRRNRLRRGRLDPVVGERDDPEPRDRDAGRLTERRRHDVRILPVGPGDDRQQELEILDSPSHRA